jgi:hypothetical protein
MPRSPNKRSTSDVAEDMKEPMGVAETSALAIAAVHEAVGRAAQKIADGGKKIADGGKKIARKARGR